MWKRDKLSRTYCARKNETQKHLIHKEFEKLRKKKNLQYVNLRMNASNSFLTKIVMWKEIWQLITLKPKRRVHQKFSNVKTKISQILQTVVMLSTIS